MHACDIHASVFPRPFRLAHPQPQLVKSIMAYIQSRPGLKLQLCVQVTKSPKPVASCAMPAGPGMDIKTDTPLVKKAREGVMEFLLVCTLITRHLCLCSVSASCQHLSGLQSSHSSSMLDLTSTASTPPCMPQVGCLGKLLVHLPFLLCRTPDSDLFCRSIIPLIAQFAIKVGSVICKTRPCSMAVTGAASLR